MLCFCCKNATRDVRREQIPRWNIQNAKFNPILTETMLNKSKTKRTKLKYLNDLLMNIIIYSMYFELENQSYSFCISKTSEHFCFSSFLVRVFFFIGCLVCVRVWWKCEKQRGKGGGGERENENHLKVVVVYKIHQICHELEIKRMTKIAYIFCI